MKSLHDGTGRWGTIFVRNISSPTEFTFFTAVTQYQEGRLLKLVRFNKFMDLGTV
jgi:hypothetical protein